MADDGQTAMAAAPRRRGLGAGLLHVAQSRWKKLRGAVRGIHRALKLAALDKKAFQDTSKAAIHDALAGATEVKLAVETKQDLASINYNNQGDATMYTPEALAQRHAIRHDPLVVQAIQAWWRWMPKARPGNPSNNSLPAAGKRGLVQPIYCAMVCGIQLVLLPRFDMEPDEEYDPAEDWEADSKGDEVMLYPDYFDALFELADMWCDSVNAADYAKLLDSLLQDCIRLENETGAFSKLFARFGYTPPAGWPNHWDPDQDESGGGCQGDDIITDHVTATLDDSDTQPAGDAATPAQEVAEEEPGALQGGAGHGEGQGQGIAAGRADINGGDGWVEARTVEDEEGLQRGMAAGTSLTGLPEAGSGGAQEEAGEQAPSVASEAVTPARKLSLSSKIRHDLSNAGTGAGTGAGAGGTLQSAAKMGQDRTGNSAVAASGGAGTAKPRGRQMPGSSSSVTPSVPEDSLPQTATQQPDSGDSASRAHPHKHGPLGSASLDIPEQWLHGHQKRWVDGYMQNLVDKCRDNWPDNGQAYCPPAPAEQPRPAPTLGAAAVPSNAWTARPLGGSKTHGAHGQLRKGMALSPQPHGHPHPQDSAQATAVVVGVGYEHHTQDIQYHTGIQCHTQPPVPVPQHPHHTGMMVQHSHHTLSGSQQTFAQAMQAKRTGQSGQHCPGPPPAADLASAHTAPVTEQHSDVSSQHPPASPAWQPDVVASSCQLEPAPATASSTSSPEQQTAQASHSQPLSMYTLARTRPAANPHHGAAPILDPADPLIKIQGLQGTHVAVQFQYNQHQRQAAQLKAAYYPQSIERTITTSRHGQTRQTFQVWQPSNAAAHAAKIRSSVQIYGARPSSYKAMLLSGPPGVEGLIKGASQQWQQHQQLLHALRSPRAAVTTASSTQRAVESLPSHAGELTLAARQARSLMAAGPAPSALPRLPAAHASSAAPFAGSLRAAATGPHRSVLPGASGNRAAGGFWQAR